MSDQRDDTDGEAKKAGDDYDGAWKSIIDELTEPFFALLFPQVHEAIDWRVPAELLDTELHELAAAGDTGKGIVDRLIKLQRKRTAEDIWVLVHVEVQAQYDADFAERMFRYHYRIVDFHDRRKRVPISLAVLADESRRWRPASYEHGECGCKLTLTFPTVKLLDFDLAALEASDNVFADVVIAHRQAQQTRGEKEAREPLRQQIARRLLKRGLGQRVIKAVVDFLERAMALPPELEDRHRRWFMRETEELGMPYYNYWEREGIKKGLEEGEAKGLKEGEAKGKRDAVLQALDARFGAVPEAVVEAVRAIDDLARLDSLLRLAVVAESLAAFEALLSPSA